MIESIIAAVTFFLPVVVLVGFVLYTIDPVWVVLPLAAVATVAGGITAGYIGIIVYTNIGFATVIPPVVKGIVIAAWVTLGAVLGAGLVVGAAEKSHQA